MKSTKIAAGVACALAGMCAMSAQAIEIYPVDHARFMTNARFDFKVELDNVTARDKVTGRLELGSFTDKETGFVSLVRLVDATFEVVK